MSVRVSLLRELVGTANVYSGCEWFEVVSRLFFIAEKEFQPEAFFVAGREIDDLIIFIGSTILGVISSYVVDLNNRFWHLKAIPFTF